MNLREWGFILFDQNKGRVVGAPYNSRSYLEGRKKDRAAQRKAEGLTEEDLIVVECFVDVPLKAGIFAGKS